MNKTIKNLLDDVSLLLSELPEHQKRTILSRIECAAQSLVGIEKDVDTGPWSISGDGRFLSSDNFDHDVQLKVSGDFYSDESRIAYLKALASRLNQNKELPLGLPKEAPAGLLYSMALRFRHDFGLNKEKSATLGAGMTDLEREYLLLTMKQLYEEVAGHGFFTWN